MGGDVQFTACEQIVVDVKIVLYISLLQCTRPVERRIK